MAFPRVAVTVSCKWTTTKFMSKIPSAIFVVRSYSTGDAPERSAKNNKQLPKLTLYSKPAGCSLCVVAKKALAPYTNRLEMVEVDIMQPENKPWFDKYQYEIPVFHFNGQFLMKHRVDAKLLEQVLTKWEQDNSITS